MSENQKSYPEILEYARGIHPQAQVRLTFERRWEIVIPTEFEESYGLDETYRGTFAWEAYESFSTTSGEDDLERWARKNGFYDAPWYVVAENYNYEMGRSQALWEAEQAAVKAAGFGDDILKIDFKSMSDEDFERYKAVCEKAADKVKAEWLPKQEAVRLLTENSFQQ